MYLHRTEKFSVEKKSDYAVEAREVAKTTLSQRRMKNADGHCWGFNSTAKVEGPFGAVEKERSSLG
jgi:hypothetical protein